MEISLDTMPRIIQGVQEALGDDLIVQTPVPDSLPSPVLPCDGPPLTSRKGSIADCPPDLLAQLERFEKLFIVPTEKLKEITVRFVTELEKGLTLEGGDIPMLPTWCMAYPTGKETGTFLAIDMGGSNLRVCEISLPSGPGVFDIIQSKYRLPEELKSSTADELWGFVADCIKQFVEYHHEGERMATMPLGFTFSYPVTQQSIDHGNLQRWTKGFNVPGVEGHDVVPQFEAALKSRVCVNTSTG
jgi:hexokinase